MVVGRRVPPTSAPTRRRNAPVWSSNAKVPPTSRMTTTTSAASTIPRGTASRARSGPTGDASTRWYVPAMATDRPVVGSVLRSNSPGGNTHVNAAATSTPPSSSTSGCGRRNLIGSPGDGEGGAACTTRHAGSHRSRTPVTSVWSAPRGLRRKSARGRYTRSPGP